MSKLVVVEISNRQEKYPLDASLLEKSVKIVADSSHWSELDISLAVVDDSEMQELNRQFLDHDYPTDVLSFPLNEHADRLEGEIIVSVDTAAKKAKELGIPWEQELVLYVVHGILHLIGFKDKSDDDRRVMREQEANFMNQLGFGDDVHGESDHFKR